MITNGLSSSAVLAAFVEPFVEGRRAVVFGSSASATPRLLLERGARVVHVCDPAPLRVAEALRRPSQPGLSLSTLNDDEIAAREGAVDCVIVEHLGAFDARSAVERAKRLLAVRGVALFVTPNREARRPLLPAAEFAAAPLDYYALYDLVSAEFETVRMFGQAPFVGYAVVDFSPESEPEPTVDSDFVPRGSEEPELFVALAARHRPSAAGHVLVQLPLASVASALSSGERAPRGERVAPAPDLVRKLEQQEGWIRELEARAATADERADLAEEELEALRERVGRDQGSQSEQSAALEAARQVERTALEAARQVERTALEAARQTERLALERQAELGAALEREHAAFEEARRDRDALAVRVAELELVLSRRNSEIAGLKSDVGADAGRDLAELEEKLVERGQEIRRLERDLAEVERIGKELLSELGTKAALPAEPGPPEVLDALALRLATAEADREALGWLVASRSPA